MGPILDRRIEHLGSADLAVIQARRILLRAVAELQNGSAPLAATEGALYRVRAYDAFNTEPDFARLMETHGSELLAQA
jgi:hypothetical protein